MSANKKKEKVGCDCVMLFLQLNDVQVDGEMFKSIWKTPVPPKVQAFSWRVVLDRIQSRQNLRKRGILQQGQHCLCVLCQESEESSVHLLFSCKFAWRVWMLCYGWLGVQTVLPEDCHMHFKQHFVQGNKSSRLGWWAVWCSCTWSIWLVRNDVIFRNSEANAESVFEAVKFRSWNWIRNLSKGFSYSLFEWNLNPLVCISGMQ